MNLEHWFKKVQVSIDADEGDDNNDGDLWALKEPEAQESWTMLHNTFMEHIVFGHTFHGNVKPQCLSMSEKVVDIVHESNDIVRVHSKTTEPSPYKFNL